MYKHPFNSRINIPNMCYNQPNIQGPTSNKINGSLIIINGPFGSGKTSISHILETDYNYTQLDGDGVHYIKSQNKEYSIGKDDIHADLLFMAHKLLQEGDNVVISHTILPDFWILYEYFLKERNINYTLITLAPDFNILQPYQKQYQKTLIDKDYLYQQYQEIIQSPIFHDTLYHITDESEQNLAHYIINTLNIQTSTLPFLTSKLSFKSQILHPILNY